MFFMPFQVLGIWLRGLLSCAVLGLGVYLFFQWYDHRQVVLEEHLEVVRDASGRAPAEQGEDGRELPRSPVVREERDRVVSWQFGWNKETAFLLGGLLLIAWSFGGRIAASVFRRRASEVPAQEQTGEVQRLQRPDGTEIHVELHGPPDGLPIVLTHGWGLDGEEWHYTRRRLAGRYRVILWDLPGLGRSTRPADNDWSLEKLAGDLEAVLALAGGRPAVLLGHSIGGMITLTFCRLFPEALGHRVCGLVLAHSTYTNPVKTTSMAGLLTILQKPVLEPLCHLMVWLAPLVWLMNALSCLNGSAQRSTERASFSGRESRWQLNFMAGYYVRAWPAVVARGFLAMFRYDAGRTLPTISVPTLVVAGDQDAACTPQASAFMRDAIPDARLLTLEPAKHCGLFEHHEPFDKAVEVFVAECATRSVEHAGR